MKRRLVRRWGRRGVALILALFTTAILVTLSLAFIALAVGESRTSNSAAYESASIDAANFGVMLAINYMGRGKVPIPGNPPSNVTVWQPRNWPDNIGFYNVPAKQLSPVLSQGYSLKLLSPTEEPSLTSYATSSMVSDPTYLTQIQQDVRHLTVVNPATLGQGLIPLGTDLAFTVDLVVVPVLPATRVASLQLISTSRVYKVSDTSSGNITGQPVATRVIQARILPEAASSYLHFLANGRTFTAQGVGYNSTLASVSGSGLTGSQQAAAFAADAAAITNYALIPGNFTENGPMRVDGENPALANNGTTPFQQTWNNAVYGAGGNLDFAPDATTKAQGGNVTFQDMLTINKTGNQYGAAGLSDANSGFFAGGFRSAVPHFGLPDVNMAEFQQAATDVTAANMTSAAFKVQTSDIPGATGSNATAPRSSGDPIYSSFTQMANPAGGSNVSVGVAFDYRPRIPRVDITLSNGTVIAQETNVDTNAPIGAPTTIPVSQVNNGIVYVDGGNAGVKTDPANPFNGQLTVVAADSSQRTSGAPGASIYSDAAAAYFASEKARWDAARANGTADAALAATIQTPPYSNAQLQAAYASNAINVTPPPLASGTAATQSFSWPSPAPDVVREGNLVITDDVKYGAQRTNSLGLIAQNFVLLNDGTPGTPGQGNTTMEIDAVLLSQNKSVQFDWDNTAHMPSSTWQTQASVTNTTANTTAYNGQINLKGSIVGEFIDIEGDLQGRGYTTQNFLHDPNLAYQRPPLFPSWDFSQLPGGFQFAIIQYKDLGVLGAN